MRFCDVRAFSSNSKLRNKCRVTADNKFSGRHDSHVVNVWSFIMRSIWQLRMKKQNEKRVFIEVY